MELYLGIDIGGTFIKYGVYDKDYYTYLKEEEATKREPKLFLQQLIELITCVQTTHDIQGIGISIGGFINPVTGENTDFSVDAKFTTYNLKWKLEKVIGLPVVVENDANYAL